MQAFARDPDGELPPADAAGQDQNKQPGAQRSEAEILLAITDLIVSGNALPGLFEELAPLLRELTNGTLVKFALYDSVQNHMVNHFWKKETGMGVWDTSLVEESPEGWVWEHQEALTIPEVGRETRFAGTLSTLRNVGVKSYAVLPMSTPRHRYGALGLGKSEPTAGDTQEVQVLIRAAAMVALVMENQETHRAWEAQQDRLQSLVAISRELRTSLEQEQLEPIIFANLQRIMKYDNAFLGLLEEDKRFLHIQSVDAMPGSELQFKGQRLLLAEAASAQAIEEHKVTFFSGEELDKLGTPVTKEMRRVGIESVCIVPLLSRSQVLGSMGFSSRRSNAFHLEDAGYLQQVGDQIAAALDNCQAYREVARVKDRLTREKNYLENEIRDEQRLDDIVGNSTILKRVLDQASIVANTDATVLITGETGTGKERVARAIHAMSSRRDCSFIKLNCAAIPTGLLESELFGHERGAFTGAVTQKVGRLELADKGTLLLDEIGEIPLELQPKLLRVVQDQEFERLGGTKTIRVDVRLLAATNRDLLKAVEEKEFRADLYYRLHVFPLHLPSLRERREDIPLLIRHFVEKCAIRMNRQIDFIPDEAVEVMMNWTWPGNIRELENFIERSVILSEGNRLRPPLAELRQEAMRRAPDLERTLRDRERDHIIEILRQTRGVLSGAKGAATRLGLKRTTLQYKMQKLGISRSDYLD
jgi:formate hydrogenlyase transcriptional activator